MRADMGTRNLKFGTTYPTLDLGTDPAVLHDWAVGMESIGFDEIFVPEHVVGINAGLRPDLGSVGNSRRLIWLCVRWTRGLAACVLEQGPQFVLLHLPARGGW